MIKDYCNAFSDRSTKLMLPSLIKPVFIADGRNIRKPLKSLPAVSCFSLDNLSNEIKSITDAGINAISLFEISNQIHSTHTSIKQKSIIPEAIKIIKNLTPQLSITCDLCFCQYFEHAHCGIISENKIEHENSTEALCQLGLQIAQAGADILMPSGMLDGVVYSLRETLNQSGFKNVLIMNQSAKFDSVFYGPFRQSAQSGNAFGISKKDYQISFQNGRQALQELQADYLEGADILMVKPALSNLDIIRKAKDKFNMPIAAFVTSGEYSMLSNYAEKFDIEFSQLANETLQSIKRAGADMVVSYFY